jgi:hypothetical protein
MTVTTHGGSRKGAGRKPQPPRIIRDHLVMSVRHLSRARRTALMVAVREFWLDQPTTHKKEE